MAGCNPAKANSTDESGTRLKQGSRRNHFLVCLQATQTQTPTPTQTQTPAPAPSGGASCLPAPGHIQARDRHPPMPHALRRQAGGRPGRTCFHYDFSPCLVRNFQHGHACGGSPRGPPRGRTRVCRPAIAGTAGRRLWANCTRTALVPAGRLGTMPITRHSGQDSAMRMRAIAASS